MFLPRTILEEKLSKILAEDVGLGDTTTELVIPPDATAEAEVIAKQAGIVAGIEETQTLLTSLNLKAHALVKDGQNIRPQQTLLKISGNARAILSTERTLLNILSRMSGIATTTRNLLDKLQKAKLETKIACTRKTAPGLLYLDKKAVSIGGGDTHRLHLDDMILIKDNHIAIAGNIKKAVETAKKRASVSKKIEVEATNAKDALEAMKAGADIIMLDNFAPKKIMAAMKALKAENKHGKVIFEASGGITTENILQFASTGVDVVSLGEITQSAKALNISLEIVKPAN